MVSSQPMGTFGGQLTANGNVEWLHAVAVLMKEVLEMVSLGVS